MQTWLNVSSIETISKKLYSLTWKAMEKDCSKNPNYSKPSFVNSMIFAREPMVPTPLLLDVLHKPWQVGYLEH